MREKVRNQFTFYGSFADSIFRIKKKTDRCDAWDAIISYAIYGEEPDMDTLPDAAAIAFDLVRPNLDSAKKMSEGSRKVRSRSDEGSVKVDARSGKGSDNKVKGKKEKEIEIEIEDKCLQVDGDLAKVFDYFLDRVDPMPSSSCTEDLKMFTENMGADVVIHACEVARDAKGVQAGWSYIRGILRRYAENKVTSMEDVLRLEQAHQAKKGVTTLTGREEWNTDIEYLEQLLAKSESAEGVS